VALDVVPGSSELSFRSPYRAVAQIDAGGLCAFEDDEWLPTGDLASPLPSGHWEIAGRANEIFKRHGEKVSVPSVLAAIGRVYSGEIGQHRDEDRGGEDGYVLVLSPAPTAAELTAILRTLRKDHARSQWPLRIQSIETMPMLPNGKPDQQALAAVEARETHWDQRV
jgi:2,3-dihydroxybenzoate-AMP ligase